MTEMEIVAAWQRIRRNDNVIPDKVLDFMKDSAIEKIKEIEKDKRREEMKRVVESPNSRWKWKKDSSHYRSWKWGMRDLEGAYELEMIDDSIK